MLKASNEVKDFGQQIRAEYTETPVHAEQAALFRTLAIFHYFWWKK